MKETEYEMEDDEEDVKSTIQLEQDRMLNILFPNYKISKAVPLDQPDYTETDNFMTDMTDIEEEPKYFGVRGEGEIELPGEFISSGSQVNLPQRKRSL